MINNSTVSSSSINMKSKYDNHTLLCQVDRLTAIVIIHKFNLLTNKNKCVQYMFITSCNNLKIL